MASIQYVSAQGLEKLKEELNRLKTVDRREAASRIESAKALGDLSENAEYHDAKDQMAWIEGRVMEIEELLKNASVIEKEKGSKSQVRVGSTVEILVGGKAKTFQIVGSNEADPMSGKVSNESPIGHALIGAKVGDKVEVKTPVGVTIYEIKAII